VEKLALRALALVAVVMAVAVLAAVRADEPLTRSIAKAAFAATLGYAAWRGWRRAPQRQPDRLRRRALRLLGVLATPEVQLDYQESSPSVPLAAAMVSDWRAVVEAGEARDAFAAREIEALGAVSSALAGIPPEKDAAALRDDARWREVVAAARAALAALGAK
jgi:hypothetical protein